MEFALLGAALVAAAALVAQPQPRATPVLVSLTTSPERIAHIGPLLRGLARQTRVPDRVVLNLPRVFRRTGATFGALPDFVTRDPLVLVHWVDDAGPASKIVHAAALVDDPDAVLISVAQHFFRSQALQRLQPPSSAVAAYLLRLRN